MISRREKEEGGGGGGRESNTVEKKSIEKASTDAYTPVGRIVVRQEWPAGDELQIGSDDGVTVLRYTVIRIIMRIREAGLP